MASREVEESSESGRNPYQKSVLHLVIIHNIIFEKVQKTSTSRHFLCQEHLNETLLRGGFESNQNLKTESSGIFTTKSHPNLSLKKNLIQILILQKNLIQILILQKIQIQIKSKT